jgi:hypothetical protein
MTAVSRWPAPVAALWSPTTWRSALYLLSSVVLGTVMFVVTVALVVSAWAASIVWIGVPVLLVVAAVVRALAHVERQRAALIRPATATATRPRPAAPPGTGLLAQVRRAWTDPAVGRACGYLVGLYLPLLVLDVGALSVGLACLAGITLPLWSWSLPLDTVSWLWIGELPWSLLVAGVSAFLLFVGAGPLLVAAARVHAGAAGGLLGPPVDPLADARAVLARPGPLRPLPSRAEPAG